MTQASRSVIFHFLFWQREESGPLLSLTGAFPLRQKCLLPWMAPTQWASFLSRPWIFPLQL